jgi:hypothetical protein
VGICIKANGYPQMRQILQLSQISKLQVQTVDQEPTVDAAHAKQDPYEAHENVVGENHVVHNRSENERNRAKQNKHSEGV